MPNDNTIPHRRGGNKRNADTRHPRRLARRERAAENAVSRSERSVEDQLELIAQRAGYSHREVSRLTGGEFLVADEALRALRES